MLVATLVASALMQAVTVALWMNPLTQRIILTPEFGQSQKLIAYELGLQGIMAAVEGLAIARILR